ncbi:MAG: FHA domain-containing protein [Bacteroidales bacterium]|nr:FHA domain-containing protein [Bacteroidales bacterium]
MDKIRIKCPVCGVVLEVDDNPAYADKFVVCPNCREKRKFAEFKRYVPSQAPADDETEADPSAETVPGFLLDRKTGMRYELSDGWHTVGRKPVKTPPKADIAIVTDDMGVSRVHMKVKVALARDGRHHVYVTNAENKNPTYINGEPLKKGDIIGLRNGDIVRLSDTELQYVGTVIDDKTELEYKKK